MGYTNYWEQKKVSNEKFKKFSQTCKSLYENLPKYSKSAGGCFHNDILIIKDGWGKGKPIFNDNEVCFNGDSDKDLDHETFQIKNQDDDFVFCKTER